MLSNARKDTRLAPIDLKLHFEILGLDNVWLCLLGPTVESHDGAFSLVGSTLFHQPSGGIREEKHPAFNVSYIPARSVEMAKDLPEKDDGRDDLNSERNPKLCGVGEILAAISDPLPSASARRVFVSEIGLANWQQRNPS